MLKLGGNGVRRLLCSSHILRVRCILHYSKSLEAKEPANSLSSVSTYLVETLGFSNQQALSTSNKLIRTSNKVSHLKHFNVATNADSVVKFFEQNGFNRSHIQKVVSSFPIILLARVDKTLKPKCEDSKELGLSGFDNSQIVSRSTCMLNQSLNSSVLPAIQALRTVLCCDDDVIAIIEKAQWVVLDRIAKYLVPNVKLMQSYGIPIELIQKRMLQKPRCFTLRTESVKDVLIKVEHKWGICRDSKMFLTGIIFLTACTESALELKCQMFRNCGWADSDIVAIFRRNPYTFNISEERMKKKLNFLMNELKYEPSYLAAYPCLFTYSLEKRIVPRHKVLLLLKEKGLIEKEYPLLNAVIYSETRFLRMFVRPFKDKVPNVHEIYANSMGITVGLGQPAQEEIVLAPRDEIQDPCC